jgi:hypothetical protein
MTVKKNFSIKLKLDPNQKQPVFDINQRIENETFTIGINPVVKNYSTISFVLQNLATIPSNVSVELEMEGFDIDY